MCAPEGRAPGLAAGVLAQVAQRASGLLPQLLMGGSSPTTGHGRWLEHLPNGLPCLWLPDAPCRAQLLPPASGREWADALGGLGRAVLSPAVRGGGCVCHC